MFFLLTSGNLLVNKTDLRASYLSGTYCRKTGTRPPSCNAPRKPTMYASMFFTPNKQKCMLLFLDTDRPCSISSLALLSELWQQKKREEEAVSAGALVENKTKSHCCLFRRQKNEKINNWTEKNNNNRPFSDLICEKWIQFFGPFCKDCCAKILNCITSCCFSMQWLD